jgi:hypothetical protein
MLLYFLHLVHKLKWSGCLACCILLLEFTFQACVSDGYPGIGCACCRKRARERRKRSLPAARAEIAKNLFHQPRTELSSSSWRCGVESGQPYLPNSKMTTTSIMCFDRHAIAVTTIGDNGNKSLYLPRKHLSIHTHKRSFFHVLRPITLCSHRQRDNMRHVCLDRHLIAVPTVVDHRNMPIYTKRCK